MSGIPCPASATPDGVSLPLTVYRIYRELELNLRIKPRRRLKREKPEELAVPDAPNMAWSMDFMADRLADGRQFRLLNVLDGNRFECPTGNLC
jgi:hypothetical protein